MIDKAEQRRRAAEMSRQLAAQGQVAPKLTYPVTPKPAPMKFGCQAAEEAKRAKKPKGVRPVKKDAVGQELRVGDIVVTTVDGIVSSLRKGRIDGFTRDRVEVEVSNDDGTYKKVLKYPQAVAKVS